MSLQFSGPWWPTQGNVRAKWDTVRRKAKLARQSVSLQTLAAERLFALFTGNREGFFTEIPNGFHSTLW